MKYSLHPDLDHSLVALHAAQAGLVGIPGEEQGELAVFHGDCHAGVLVVA